MKKAKTNWTTHIPKFVVVGVLVLGLVGAGIDSLWPDRESTIQTVAVPAFSPEANLGQALFDQNCASCHGANGAGSENGPPLVHDIYNPGHHTDQAFYAAVQQGVRQHHWPFGNMPKQPQVSSRDVANIVQYVRELQRANGIFYRQHRM